MISAPTGEPEAGHEVVGGQLLLVGRPDRGDVHQLPALLRHVDREGVGDGCRLGEARALHHQADACDPVVDEDGPAPLVPALSVVAAAGLEQGHAFLG